MATLPCITPVPPTSVLGLVRLPVPGIVLGLTG